MKTLALILLIILSSSLLMSQESNLFTQIDQISETMAALEVNKKQMEESRRSYATVNLEATYEQSFNLNLFDDVTLRCIVDREEKNQKGLISIIGHVESQDYSSVNLVVNRSGITGYIELLGVLYTIKPMSDDVHIIREINPELFIEECTTPSELEAKEKQLIPMNLDQKHKRKEEYINPDDGSRSFDPLAPGDPFSPDNGNTIDVLVVYTEDADNSVTDINAEIQAAINDANTGYTNSNINLSLNLVSTMEVSYTESGSSATDVNRLQDPDDGFMDDVHTERADQNADVVVLLVEEFSGNAAGRAFGILNPVNLFFDENAFCAVTVSASVNNHSFSHEVGHLLGARHDWFVDNTNNSPFTYNHGFVNVADAWRTVMAYNTECASNGTSCQRINHWSNPNVDWMGNPTGVAEGTANAADNHLTLENTRYCMANFINSTNGYTWGIAEILEEDLQKNHLSKLKVTVIAPDDGDYYVGIWDKDGTASPEWDWEDDFSTTPDIGSTSFSAVLAENFAIEFDVTPTSGEEDFQFWLYQKDGSTWNVIEKIEHTLKAGQPVEVALVVDRSGSMGYYGYMNSAKDAAKSFIGLMSLNDWVAVTSFSSYASTNFSFAKIASEQIRTNAINAVNSIYSSGNTSIGAGLQLAQNHLNTGNKDDTQGMILLSDGYQNTSPYVSQVLPNIPANTDIYTIALGPNSDQNLLNNIASQTGGFYSYAPNTQRLTLIYNSIRAKVTNQQILALYYDLIAQGQNIIHKVSLDAGITLVNFSVTWPGSDLDLILIDPSGNVIDHTVNDPGVSFTSGNTFENYGVLNPVPGEWTLSITGIDVSGQTNYTASVTAVSSLTMNIDFDKSIYGLNDSMLIMAELKDGADVITAATVTADVTTPLTPNPIELQGEDGGEPEGGIELFYEDIDESHARYFDSENTTFYTVDDDLLTLYDDGKHGDGAADDGVYANYFTNTSKTGSYTFDVTASGTGTNSGAFVRTDSKSTTVTTTKSISVTEPQTGTDFFADCYHNVRWSSTNISGNVTIYLSTDGGSTYSALATDIADDGTEDIMMPDLSSTNCRIKVQSIDFPAISGLNPGIFSIVTVGDAGPISGSSAVDPGQNDVVYSLAAIPNAVDYMWNYSGSGATINGNSTSITIDFATDATSGILTAKAANACGADAWSPDFPIMVTSTGADGEFIDSGQDLGASFNTYVALGDIDGDNDLDAVVTNDQANLPNKVWLNDGSGNFADGNMDFGSGVAWGLALYDFDGDGDLDAFVAKDGPNRVFLNNGSGLVSNGQSLGSLSSMDVALADLDGDGDMDAAVANNATGHPNKIWLNNGNAIFFDPGLSIGNAKSYGLALGDLDGDGDFDGFIANEGPNKVYLNNGAGTNDNGQNLGYDNSKAVKLGDMDGDGDLDAVVANNSTGQPNRVWINYGNGNYSNSGLTFGSNSSMDLALGDLDGDGDLDGFVANNGANKVYLNAGPATADNGQDLGNSNSYGVALGDLDSDGDLDAFVANYDGPSKVWLNQSNGTNGNSSHPVSENTQDGQQDDELMETELVIDEETNYMLLNYPDPFADKTNIKFRVNSSEMTSLKVYNMYGSEVAVLFNGMSNAGTDYQFTFNAQFLPKGIYILHLQVGNSISVKEKMMLIK